MNTRRAVKRSPVHPRVLLSPADLTRLRRRVRTGPGLLVMEAIRAQVRPLVRQALVVTEPGALLQPPFVDGAFASTILYALDEMAALGRIDDDAEAIEAVRRTFQAVIPADLAGAGRGHLPFSYGGMWHFAVAYDLICDSLPEAERAMVAEWLVNRCLRRTLAQSRDTYLKHSAGNTAMAGMATALFTLLAVAGDPGVPDLRGEREELLWMFKASLNTAFGENGYPVEDIGYGTSIGTVLVQLAEAVRRAGWFDAYRACPRLMRFGRAVLHFVQPWGEHLSNTGDLGDDFQHRQFALARLATETRDPALLWLLGTLSFPSNTVGTWVERTRMYVEVETAKGYRVPASWLTLAVLDDLQTPRHPARAKLPTQFVDRTRGIVSFRSGWDADATLVVFDGAQRSPSAQGHDHDSCGHFSLSALGEYFAIDTGRYSIEQDQHNVVLVDGKSGRSTGGAWRASWYHGRLTEYQPDSFCDVAAADSSQSSNCYWAYRHLGLVKGECPYIWTVEDVNFANDEREFWWTLNTSPGNRIELGTTSATIHGRRYGHKLDVHFIVPGTHRLTLTQDQPRCGSPQYVTDAEIERRRQEYGDRAFEMVHGPVFERPRLIGKVGGYNGRFMTILLPRRHDAPPATVTPLPTLVNALAAKITFADVEDTLIFAYEHNLLEAADIVARGPWIVVRRDRRSGRVLHVPEVRGLDRVRVGNRMIKGKGL